MFLYDFKIGLLSSTLSKDIRAYKNMKSIIECRFTVIYIISQYFTFFMINSLVCWMKAPPVVNLFYFVPHFYTTVYIWWVQVVSVC